MQFIFLIFDQTFLTHFIMKKNTLLLSALAFLYLTTPAEAQLLKKIQNAASQGAQNAINKKVESEAEKAASKELDKMFTGMIGEPAETETEYLFSGYMVMEVTSTDKKGKKEEPVKINYLLSPSSEYNGMWFQDEKNPEMQTSTILDGKNQATIILINDGSSKSSMAIKMDQQTLQNWVDEEVEEEISTPDYKLEKTGNTKSILGFECEEYLIASEDGQAQYWVTKEPIEGFSMFSPQSNPMAPNQGMDRYSSLFSNAPKGTFMEMIFKANDGSISEMKVISLEKNKPQRYTMADYPNLMKGMN